jgi:hypothetical protein
MSFPSYLIFLFVAIPAVAAETSKLALRNVAQVLEKEAPVHWELAGKPKLGIFGGKREELKKLLSYIRGQEYKALNISLINVAVRRWHIANSISLFCLPILIFLCLFKFVSSHGHIAP